MKIPGFVPTTIYLVTERQRIWRMWTVKEPCRWSSKHASAVVALRFSLFEEFSIIYDGINKERAYVALSRKGSSSANLRRRQADIHWFGRAVATDEFAPVP